MANPVDNFAMLLEHCRMINPASITHWHAANIESVTRHGLDLVPFDWRDKLVLIAGCGDGTEVVYARDKLGWGATGLTFQVEEREAGPAHSLVDVGDIHALPYPAETFDAIYSKELLEHSPCPILALLELARVLRTGGQFFHLIADSWNKQRDWYHFSCLPDWLWADLFHKAYCRVDEIRGFPKPDAARFENKAYQGVKVQHRAIMESEADYRRYLGFERF